MLTSCLIGVRDSLNSAYHKICLVTNYVLLFAEPGQIDISCYEMDAVLQASVLTNHLGKLFIIT